jgi:DNA processing protein
MSGPEKPFRGQKPGGTVGAARSTGVRFSDQQRLDWLRLIRTESVGPRTFLGLINRFGGASAALEALPDLVRLRLGKKVVVYSKNDAELEMALAARHKARFVCLGEPDYPALLAHADDAPPVITLIGKSEATSMPALSIVGSRNASFAGQKMTERLAIAFGEAGFCVVSGLARGIDTAAHKAALRTGTIAVMAGGLDKPYPPENRDLMAEIAEKGAVICEMPFGWEPRGRDFPRRNRIISGLSYATVIVEAAPKSGSLITARFANEQGRDVFAVPGSPLDPRAEGTNDLIFKGEARLLRKAEDVLEAIAPMLEGGLPRKDDLFGEAASEEDRWRLWDEWTGILDEDALAKQAVPEVERHEFALEESRPPYKDGALRTTILQNISFAPISVDDLARLCSAPIQAVRSVLFEMDMEGLATIDDNGMIKQNLVLSSP